MFFSGSSNTNVPKKGTHIGYNPCAMSKRRIKDTVLKGTPLNSEILDLIKIPQTWTSRHKFYSITPRTSVR